MKPGVLKKACKGGFSMILVSQLCSQVVGWHLGKNSLVFILELKVHGQRCLMNILSHPWMSCSINLGGQEISAVHFHLVAFTDLTCQYGLLVLKVFLTLYFKVESLTI
jgi:hypothetical protein